MGEMSYFKPLLKYKMTKNAKLWVGTYLFVMLPTTIYCVSVGRYSLAYGLSSHAALIPGTWAGIKLRYSHDLSSSIVVFEWLLAGITLQMLYATFVLG